MGVQTRWIATLALAVLAWGTVGSVALVATATEVSAKPDKENAEPRARGRTEDAKRIAPGQVKAKGKKKPGFCTAPASAVEPLELYDAAVTAVVGAEDAVLRAEARLTVREVPPAGATSDALAGRIAELRAGGVSLGERPALQLLERQLYYVAAVEELAALRAVQTEVRTTAAEGRQISGAALNRLRSDC